MFIVPRHSIHPLSSLTFLVGRRHIAQNLRNNPVRIMRETYQRVAAIPSASMFAKLSLKNRIIQLLMEAAYAGVGEALDETPAMGDTGVMWSILESALKAEALLLSSAAITEGALSARVGFLALGALIAAHTPPGERGEQVGKGKRKGAPGALHDGEAEDGDDDCDAPASTGAAAGATAAATVDTRGFFVQMPSHLSSPAVAVDNIPNAATFLSAALTDVFTHRENYDSKELQDALEEYFDVMADGSMDDGFSRRTAGPLPHSKQTMEGVVDLLAEVGRQ